MQQSLAIYYESDGYTTNNRRLLGRQAAGEGFLKAVVQHSHLDKLYCYTSHQQKFANFQEVIKPWNHRPLAHEWISSQNPNQLDRAGTLYVPGPGLAQWSWSRRFYDQRAYSICGVTHTIASLRAMEEFGAMFTAPVQPWDAMICTSQAVKTSVEHVFDQWVQYLSDRWGARPQLQIQLPIIPLGIDCDFFAPAQPQSPVRQRLRHALEIPPEDLVVLFVGRLCFYAKAHPVPMYIALEQAAQQTGRRIHFVQAGWFENDTEEKEFKQAAQEFCPRVRNVFVDGRQPQVRSDIWACADIFISLVDNIQETFGLTPIEAMAAGLPVIVTDWNGYKESVRDGIDGYKIPTLMPPAAIGDQFAADHFTERINYGSYVAHAAAFSVVDVPAATAALVRLIEQPELRQALGANAAQRARQVYDWSVVITAYERLWQELALIRNTQAMTAPVGPGRPAHPLSDNPYRVFGNYPSHPLGENIVLWLGAMASPEDMELLSRHPMTNYGVLRDRSRRPLIEAIVALVEKQPGITLGEVVQAHSSQPGAIIASLVLNLVKFDVLRWDSGWTPGPPTSGDPPP